MSEASDALASGDVVYEDARFRVTRWRLPEGATIPMHRHEHPYVVVPLADATMHVTTAEGELIVADLVRGTAYAREVGSEHRNANPGTELIDFIEVEWLGATNTASATQVE